MKEEKKNTEELKNDEKELTGLYKIAITREAEKALVEVTDRVNDGYNGGKASRTGVASWLIAQFAKSIDNQHIKTMRLDFLNELTLLELVVRKSREMGHLSPELKKLLLQQAGLLDEPVRKSTKSKIKDDQGKSDSIESSS